MIIFLFLKLRTKTISTVRLKTRFTRKMRTVLFTLTFDAEIDFSYTERVRVYAHTIMKWKRV